MSLTSLVRYCEPCRALTRHEHGRCTVCGASPARPYVATSEYGNQTPAAARRRIRGAAARMNRNRDRLGRVGSGN
jgi:hypothetical protein